MRSQMGTKSALVSADFVVSIFQSELILIRVAWQTLGHIVTVSFFGACDGFYLLIPVRSDGVLQSRCVCGAVVQCERLFHLCGGRRYAC